MSEQKREREGIRECDGMRERESEQWMDRGRVGERERERQREVGKDKERERGEI